MRDDAPIKSEILGIQRINKPPNQAKRLKEE